jgi:hypothetical protein
MPNVFAQVYRVGDETLITVPALKSEAGDKYAAGFVGSAPAGWMTTESGSEYPDPLYQVWHLVPPTSRKRIQRLSPTDACIWVKLPVQMVPAIIRNAALRHGL